MKKESKVYKFKITGVVQGVGFRPYIAASCIERGLSGYVENVGDGVIVVVNDEKAFREILHMAPPRIKITTCIAEEVLERHEGFFIKKSTEHHGKYAEIPPDLFLCAECTADLMDTENRRFGYFFITCTSCGPRFSIAIASPFDRVRTTMNEFSMCAKCEVEYGDPHDRRFHAQTIACPDCGPALTLIDHEVEVAGKSDELFRRVAERITSGEVVAIKGVGGFHLACAMEPECIAGLNAERGRSEKPYALLCRDIAMVRSLALLSKEEEELLMSSARPIVLLKKKNESPALFAASELDTIGVMLPYTPVHHLLFKYYDLPLVMTSANRSGEPITVTRKAQFVPVVLDHNRRIENPIDDSVVKVIAGKPLFVRRSRGYVPRSINANSTDGRSILALGAEMNNTFALFRDSELIISQHMGNTANAESFERYKMTVDKFLEYTGIVPDLIIRDAHPGYNASQYGEGLAAHLRVPILAVQHHRAHVYGVALEHGLTDFVGIACDGLGFGDDGNIWGGEVFANSKRIGHLEEQFQLGGDAASRYPHRMLYAILRNFLTATESAEYLTKRFSAAESHVLEKQLGERFNTPLTSSTGRILDAAAALLGFCDERTYDGRPAMLLEAHSSEPYEFAPIINDGVLMTTPLFEYLVRNLDKDRARLGATVQRYIAEGLYAIAAAEHKPIVFAGGCAYNRIMTSFMLEKNVLINKEIPPGDGGISAGQIAACLMSADTRNDIA